MMKMCRTPDKPMASWSVCHIGVLPWMTILFNLINFYGTVLFEQLINIARFFEMWMFVRMCVSACVYHSIK